MPCRPQPRCSSACQVGRLTACSSAGCSCKICDLHDHRRICRWQTLSACGMLRMPCDCLIRKPSGVSCVGFGGARNRRELLHLRSPSLSSFAVPAKTAVGTTLTVCRDPHVWCGSRWQTPAAQLGTAGWSARRWGRTRSTTPTCPGGPLGRARAPPPPASYPAPSAASLSECNHLPTGRCLQPGSTEFVSMRLAERTMTARTDKLPTAFDACRKNDSGTHCMAGALMARAYNVSLPT